jgi:predicted Rdx family selenoprotein
MVTILVSVDAEGLFSSRQVGIVIWQKKNDTCDEELFDIEQHVKQTIRYQAQPLQQQMLSQQSQRALSRR